MGNVNPPPTSYRPILPAALRAQAIQELHELQRISAFVNSSLESIKQFLNNFANHPNKTNMDDLESDYESVDTPLVSPFPCSDNDSDDGSGSRFDTAYLMDWIRVLVFLWFRDLVDTLPEYFQLLYLQYGVLVFSGYGVLSFIPLWSLVSGDIVEIKRLLDDLRVTASKEVIENGNAPPLKKVVEGVETTIAPLTAEEKAQRSSEVLDQTFDRLQKLISQLEIHGESISQEDVN
ncbi:hypothetical protein Tco_1239334 [Tanacetum coccineum]